jgi:YD repeat-containing protein
MGHGEGVGDNVHRFVTYTYDADGNRGSIQYPSGAAFNYAYTNRNEVASIKPGLSGGTPVVSYLFDPAGNITSRTLDNGTSTAYTVDAANRDTSLVHALNGGSKRFDYAYNNVNDIVAVQRDSNQGDAYEYDLTQEIKRFAQNGSVNLSSGTISGPAVDTDMTFDGCGNQASVSLNGNAGGTFQVNNLN